MRIINRISTMWWRDSVLLFACIVYIAYWDISDHLPVSVCLRYCNNTLRSTLNNSDTKQFANNVVIIKDYLLTEYY